MISCPWPPRVLSPNVKCHWGKKHKALKDYKDQVMWSAFSCKPNLPDMGFIYLKVTFYPPNKARRDEDNLIAQIKGLYDGLASLWGVNDYRFRCEYDWGEPVKGGKILVKVVSC